VALRGRQPAEGGRDLVRPDAAGVEEGPALDALDDSARRRGDRPAALGIEARFDHPIAGDPHRNAHHVATSSASRSTGVRMVTEGTLARGRVQMLSEGPH
jgi:hypothetical protein